MLLTEPPGEAISPLTSVASPEPKIVSRIAYNTSQQVTYRERKFE